MKKIIIVLIVIISCYVIYRVIKSPATPARPEDFFKKSPATVIPEQKPDFSKDGNIHLLNEGEETEAWRLLYEEPGRPAVTAILNFNFRSRCDFGGGEGICNEKKFENGLRVHVEGNKQDDMIKVVRLKVLE